MAAMLIGALVGGGASIVQGDAQARAQRRGLRDQREAQDRNLQIAMRQERLSAEEIARANRRAPDIGAQLIGAIEQAAAGGNRATMLRGTKPLVDPVLLSPKPGTLLGQ